MADKSRVQLVREIESIQQRLTALEHCVRASETASEQLRPALEKSISKLYKQLQEVEPVWPALTGAGKYNPGSAAALPVNRRPAAVPGQRPSATGEPSFRSLVELSGGLFFQLSRTGIIEYISPSCRQLLGYETTELQGQCFYQFVPAEDAVRLRGENMPAGSAEAAVRVVRHPFRHKRQQWVWLETRLRSEESAENIVILGCSQLAAESAPTGEADGLEQLAHQQRLTAVAEMAAGLVHELNQPLTALSAYVRTALLLLAGDSAAEQELKEILNESAFQIQHASQIVRRFRQFLRQRPPERVLSDVNERVLAALALCKALLREAGVVVERQLAETLPAMYLDQLHIEQVLVNLIRNAVEAMQDTPREQRRLTISTAVSQDEVVVSVRDAGAGLSEEMLHHLFQPFRTTKAQGLGMGLVLCQSIIQAHNGRLWGKTNPGRGATFTFALPISSGKTTHGNKTCCVSDRR